MPVCQICQEDRILHPFKTQRTGQQVKISKLCYDCMNCCTKAFGFMGDCIRRQNLVRHSLTKEWIDEYIENREIKDTQRPKEDEAKIPFREQEDCLNLIVLRTIVD